MGLIDSIGRRCPDKIEAGIEQDPEKNLKRTEVFHPQRRVS